MSLLSRTFFNIGDLQLLSGVDQAPHLEVPYPLTNGGQQLRYASGRYPAHHPSVTWIRGGFSQMMWNLYSEFEVPR